MFGEFLGTMILILMGNGVVAGVLLGATVVAEVDLLELPHPAAAKPVISAIAAIDATELFPSPMAVNKSSSMAPRSALLR